MRFLPLILILLISFTSCKSSKLSKKDESESVAKTPTITKGTNTISPKALKIYNIVKHANSFSGTKYKFGGTTKKGMDCSGLIYIAFKNEQILLPRVSKDMATRGFPISVKEIKKGDLLFFQTSKKRRGINHVGLVTNISNNTIEFIHSTTSKGVITSSLSERYWQTTFKEARRLL
ncbi:C40 family peptidase [Pontimicrobium aquaticum]|uniref:NlpC/P60 family protein n=1 Tax=Pontimicrobium aquaticum TaxID=2565367 RepID=A0A4V5LR45_9FLAO|nr:C40 family peptidase [Pontimicrobium aquaticum]TJY37679.1 NlpC/P60 family protein [Pontimicrobium aquaticum]